MASAQSCRKVVLGRNGVASIVPESPEYLGINCRYQSMASICFIFLSVLSFLFKITFQEKLQVTCLSKQLGPKARRAIRLHSYDRVVELVRSERHLVSFLTSQKMKRHHRRMGRGLCQHSAHHKSWGPEFEYPAPR